MAITATRVASTAARASDHGRPNQRSAAPSGKPSNGGGKGSGKGSIRPNPASSNASRPRPDSGVGKGQAPQRATPRGFDPKKFPQAPTSPSIPKPAPGPLGGTNWDLGKAGQNLGKNISDAAKSPAGRTLGDLGRGAGKVLNSPAGKTLGKLAGPAGAAWGLADLAWNLGNEVGRQAGGWKEVWDTYNGDDSQRPAHWSTPPSAPLSYPDRPAPFTGGQQAGIGYRVTLQATIRGSSPLAPYQVILRGPLGPLVTSSEDFGGGSVANTHRQSTGLGIINHQGGINIDLVILSVVPVSGLPDTGGDPQPAPERRQSPPPPYRLPDPPPRRDPYRDPAPDPAPPAPRKNPQSPNTPAGDPGKPSPVPTDKPKPGGPPPNRQPEVPEPYKKPAPSPRPSPTGPGTSPAGDPGPAPTPSPGPTNRPAPAPAPNKGPQVGGGAGAPQPTPAPTATRGGNSVDNASDPDGRWAEAFGGAAALAPLIPFDWSSKPSSTSDIGWGAPVALTPAQKEEFDRTGKLPDPQNQRPAVPDRPNTEAPASKAPGQKPAPTPAPVQAPAQNQAPAPTPTPAPSGDICQSPCIQAMGAGIEGAQKGVDEANLLLKKIAAVVGADPAEFPATLPLLNGAAGTPVKNLPELILAVIKNLDAVSGQYPMEITTYTSDGSEKKATVYNQAHALSELFGLAIVIAEDADAVKNIAVRNIAETIKATISAKQAAEIAKANAKYLGYTGASKQRVLKLTVTPSAVGPNNKLEQQELGDFLKPSTRNYIGWEFEGDNLQGVLFRILEGVEIARAALFHPIKSGKAAARLTGDWIKGDNKKRAKQKDERWVEIKGRLTKRGAKITETKGIKKDADPKPTDP